MDNNKIFDLLTIDIKNTILDNSVRSVLQKISDSTLKQYGFTPYKVKVEWGEPNDAVAYVTDNHECYINFNSELDEGLTFSERKINAVGKLCHEIMGHGLFTNFKTANDIVNSTSFDLLEEYFTKANSVNKESIEKSFSLNSKLFNAMFLNINNIVEDIAIEELCKEIYPGSEHYLSFTYEQLKKTTEIDSEDIFTQQFGIINAILCAIRGFDISVAKKYFQHLENIIVVKDSVSLLKKPYDRYVATAFIIDELWEYISALFKKEECQDTDDNKNNESQNNANHNDSDNNDNGNINNDTVSSDRDAEKLLEQLNLKKTTDGEGNNNLIANSDNHNCFTEDKFSKEITKSLDDALKNAYKDENTKDKIETLFFTNDLKSDKYHSSYNVKINSIKSDNKDKSVYQAIFDSECKTTADALARLLERKIKQKRSYKPLYEQEEGELLDIDAIARGVDRPFMSYTAPNKLPVCSVGIMVDLSGSMSGNRIKSATKAVLSLERFCHLLKLPLLAYGHHACGVTINIEKFVDFTNRQQNYTLSNLSEFVSGNNRDGLAIKYGMKQLSQQKAQTKILFILSDGLPNHYGYGFRTMKDEMVEIKKMCKKHNITLVPIAIGDDVNRLNELYGYVVDGRCLQKLPNLVIRTIFTNIYRKV